MTRLVCAHLYCFPLSSFQFSLLSVKENKEKAPANRIIRTVETAVPWAAFKAAGYDVRFVTENGKVPECDKKMLEGITQKLLVRNPLFKS